jgi:hypothetical protein
MSALTRITGMRLGREPPGTHKNEMETARDLT